MKTSFIVTLKSVFIGALLVTGCGPTSAGPRPSGVGGQEVPLDGDTDSGDEQQVVGADAVLPSGRESVRDSATGFRTDDSSPRVEALEADDRTWSPAECNGKTFEGSIVGTNLFELRRLDGFETITGNLAIRGIKVSDLTRAGLGCLRWVKRDLTIVNNPNLQTLDGLTSLQKVGSRLGGAMTISENRMLKNLEGLASLQYIGGDFAVDLNKSLGGLGGLGGLVTIRGGCLGIIGNEALSTCEARRFVETMRSKGFRGTDAPIHGNNSSIPCPTKR